MAKAHGTWSGDTTALLTGPRGPMVRRATEVSADIVSEATRLLNNGVGPAGVRVRTGRLKTSLEERLTVRGRRIRITVGTRVEYAPLVHNGRGPVRPRNAKVLRWVTPGGQVVFSRKAGPARARPFLMTATVRVLGRHGISVRGPSPV